VNIKSRVEIQLQRLVC